MVPKAAAIPIHLPPAMTVRANNNMDDQASSSADQRARPTRPNNRRSSTDPSQSPSLLLQSHFKDKDSLIDWARPSSGHRPRSHLRSRSSGAVAGLPLMTRAHSMPSPHTPRALPDTPSAGSSSPMRTPARTRSPFLPSEEITGIESIQEDSELDLRPRSQQSGLVQPTALRASRVTSRGRRRPASPLSNLPFSQPPPQAPTSFPMDQHTPAAGSASASAPLSASSSPSLPPQKEKYNEAYPSPASFTLHHHSSTSSMASFSSLNSGTSYPSTPTSARSRSPSISSLGTIEDEPEMEAIERLKEDAEEEEGGSRRSSLDGGGRSPSDGGGRQMVGFGFTRGRSERKRWSVCGGERRADLDLETIWED